MKRIQMLGCPMDATTMEDTVRSIVDRIERRVFTQHVVVNVAKIVQMQSNRELARSVQDCDVINIDGMGVVWGARLLGHAVPERVAGVDLFEKLIEESANRGFPVYLLGATDAVVEETARVLSERHPTLKLVGFNNGYFWDDVENQVKRIRDSGARLLFVAITSPKKEIFIDQWKGDLGVDFVMGVGGTFDVVAGKVRRAPKWMQRTGMEWLFRVIQEPRRMWRRYLVTNLQFAFMLGKACVASTPER
jgi:N-acetylglucosaminyldiphosphoundecaprenol N-acetyl-beta-D-mannosaminyltransferase